MSSFSSGPFFLWNIPRNAPEISLEVMACLLWLARGLRYSGKFHTGEPARVATAPGPFACF